MRFKVQSDVPERLLRNQLFASESIYWAGYKLRLTDVKSRACESTPGIEVLGYQPTLGTRAPSI